MSRQLDVTSPRRRIHPNVVALGWVSFFTDVASEMILPLLPLFLTVVLGASKSVLGAIEGIAEATTSLLKLASGWYADRTGRPKRLVTVGYSTSNLVKPLLAACTSWPQVLAVRFLDRVGKGVRTAPRDAIIAGSARSEVRGRSFGIHRAMDTAGAILGSLIAFLVMAVWKGAYRTVFALALVPGLMALVILVKFVQEPARPSPLTRTKRESFTSSGYSVFLAILGLFTFSHITYAFYILRAHDLGVAEKWIPIAYMIYNVVYALLATPLGGFSDRVGRGRVLTLGFLANGALLLGFGFATRTWHAWLLFVFYGLVSAVVETVPRALVADLVAEHRRGMGYGFYHAVVGLLPLPANVAFGALWQAQGPRLAFGLWAGLSLLAAVFLTVWLSFGTKAKPNAGTSPR